jgi:ribosome biogenesis GTPase / thiamine phosphate phosphatase
LFVAIPIATTQRNLNVRGYQTAAELLRARRSTTTIISGTVTKKLLGHYVVAVDEEQIVCSLSSRLRKVLIYPVADATSLHPRVQEVGEIRVADPVAVGDIVSFVPAEDGTGMIVEVAERINALVRRAAGPKPLEQVIVANVDQVVCVVAAAQPAPNWELLDRYLVAAASCDLPALICITKSDLADRETLADEIAEYERIGFSVIVTSATTGEGTEQFRQMVEDRVSVFAGKSGVGKTSLLNAIEPGLGLRVNAVSAKTGKGKHTTTHLELFPLANGGSIADTPGMREFGLWNVGDRDLAALFPEFVPLLDGCRFGADCSHDHEPGCAVKAAVADGAISPRRHASYLRIRRSQ